MKIEEMDFPHPLLSESSEDYINSTFDISIFDKSDNGPEMVFTIRCCLNCQGLYDLISQGKAKAVLRLTCHRTSYRETFPLSVSSDNEIRIKKNLVADKMELKGLILATEDFSGFNLPEFNPAFFEGTEFRIRKGDILAEEPGVRVTFDSLTEQNLAGIVQINKGDVPEIKVHFAKENETLPSLTNYIVITLPNELYVTYFDLRKKRYLKTGIERFLLASIIFPSIVEGIGRLRAEKDGFYDELGEEAPNYKETEWGRSINKALEKLGITDILSCDIGDYELANRLLGDVVGDSIRNLKKKADDWTRINEEDSDR